LPFHGEWTVAQAHNGEITHKGEWAHAWDFIIIDKEEKQFRGEGNTVEDYFCYNKLIVSPAYGNVVDIIDGIEDNEVGEVNIIHNWGNTIVIKHAEYLYSQISHLKPGSFKVKKGDSLKKGDIIAQCGNSGRSPFPHLHFQIQATPFIGSKTLDYPIDHSIVKKDNKMGLISYSKPLKDEIVSNIDVEPLLKNALNFVPGQELHFRFKKKNKKAIDVVWEIMIDIYNHTYIYCSKSNSYAYFFNDGSLIYFKNFIGNKYSPLYFFYLALYKVPFGFYQNVEITDTFPINLVYNKYLIYIQDVIAPFYLFLKSKFLLTYKNSDTSLSPSSITLESRMNTSFFGLKRELKFKILVDKNGISEIESEFFLLKSITDK
jgi:hypothetical protein